MKILSLLLLYFIFLSEILVAQEKEIKTENNQYQMKNICSNENKVNEKKKSFGKYYKFTFQSKYNVFENYENAFNNDDEPFVIKTDLYSINIINPWYSISTLENQPEILKNKKTIEFVLDEGDMQKIYQSKSAKVVFPPSMFNKKYRTRHKQEHFGHGLYYPSIVYLQPVISITLNMDDFNRERAKCTKKENKYIKDYEEYHSKPMNRIKTFFDF